MTKAWDELEKDFAHVVFSRGVGEVAEELHVDRATVYRLVTGRTSNPSGPVREGVERLIEGKRTHDRHNDDA